MQEVDIFQHKEENMVEKLGLGSWWWVFLILAFLVYYFQAD